MTFQNPIGDTSLEVLRIPIPVILSDLAGNSYTLNSAGALPVATTGGVSLAGNTGIAASVPLIVQKANAKSTGSVTTLAVAFTNANVAGNTIVVVAASGSNTAMTVADSNSNTYTSAISAAQSTVVGTAIFYAVNVAGGVNTVTLTCASSSAAIQIYEVSGVLANVLGALGQTSSGSSSSATALVTSAIAGSGNCLAFMGAGIGTAVQTITVTTGTNWTADAGTNGLVPTTPAGLYQFQALSQFLPGIKPVLPTATAAGSEPYAAVAAIFRPVALNIQGAVTLGGYNYTHITSAATALNVKTGPGVLHAITVNTPVGSGTIEFDDAVSHTNPMGIITFPATILSIGSIPYLYDIEFATGLNITTTGTMDITVAWR